MITVLFWNTCGNRLASVIGRLVDSHDVDILLLAEFRDSIAGVLGELNDKRKLGFHAAPSSCQRIMVFSRHPSQFIRPIYESSYLTVRHVRLPYREEFLLAAAHLRSKLYQSPDSQILECTRLSDDIRCAEKHVGIQKTVLVGDLNMNPFESGVVGANGLHAVMTQERAQRGVRKVGGKEYPFFYNPMWGFFGDLTKGPPGTYHYDSAEQVTYFWNIFDQVLIRPALLQHFDATSLKVISGDEKISLLNEQGIPDKANVSDHLPIVFRLYI